MQRSGIVKRVTAAAGLAAVVLTATFGASALTSFGALAQPYGYGRPGPGFPQKGPGPGPYQAPARQADHGEPGGPPGRGAGLSPEERRQLRRDIEQHGREIYPDPRRGGGPGRR